MDESFGKHRVIQWLEIHRWVAGEWGKNENSADGISEGVRLNPTTARGILTKLITEGLVKREMARVKGRPQRVYCHTLTTEGRRVALELLANGDSANFQRGQIYLLAAEGAFVDGDLQEAQRELDMAFKFVKNFPELWAEAHILSGNIASMEEDWNHSEKMYFKAIEILEREELRLDSGRVQSNLGIMYRRKGDMAAAVACFELLIDSPDAKVRNHSQLELAYVLALTDEGDAARDALKGVLAFFESMNDTNMVAAYWKVMGVIARTEGKLELSREYLLKAKELNEKRLSEKYYDHEIKITEDMIED